ncbi:hypothetical protein [Actinomycetospora chlora]|uniref:hypothetical protein n=1 Tax=Actinomycetospora chlora TaxID=663608 RepID=UPI0031EBDB7B
MGWSVSSLVRAEAIERPRRAMYTISGVGRRLLEQYPAGLTENELREIPAYRDDVPVTKGPSTAAPGPATTPGGDVLDPRERICAGIEQILADVAVELRFDTSGKPSPPSSNRWSSTS